MKLKLNEDGSAVVADGMPVYVHDDGSEVPFDVTKTMRQVDNFAQERDRYHTKIKGFEKTIDGFKDDAGNLLDIDEAKKALKTVKNLSEEQLFTADKVETMRQKMGETFTLEKQQLAEKHKNDLTEKDGEIERLNGNVRGLLVRNAFSQSKFFSGEDPITNMPPDVAADFFGKYFKVEGEGMDATLVGVLNGEVIPSKKSYGHVADFDESIEAIINVYPHKDRIMKTRSGGPGAHGNLEHRSDGRQVTISRKDAMDPGKYRAARKAAEEKGLPLRVAE